MRNMQGNVEVLYGSDKPLERSDIVTGTDIAGIMDDSVYGSTPLIVWSQKKGRIPQKSENEAMKLGKQLEPTIIDLFHRYLSEQGFNWNAPNLNSSKPSFSRRLDPFYKRFYASPDEITVEIAENGNFSMVHGVEAKIAGARSIDKWGVEPPSDYVWQVRWYCFIHDCQFWYIAALLGGTEFKVYRIERDFQIESHMLEKVDQFLFMLDENIMPPISQKNPKADNDALGVIYTGNPNDPVIKGGDSEAELLRELLDAERSVIEAETRKSEVQAKIKQILGDNTRLMAGEYTVTWTAEKCRNEIDKAEYIKACEEMIENAVSKDAVIRLQNKCMKTKTVPRRFMPVRLITQ